MKSTGESPRFILILGSLLLLAYAAYNIGIAWMDSVPGNSTAFEPATQTLTPTITQTPSITPTSVPLYWITPTNTPGGATATLKFSATPLGTKLEESIASTPVPAESTPTLIPTPTTIPDSAYPPPGEDQTATVPAPTPTSTGDTYPGPGATAPVSVGTQDPYPAPGVTPSPTSDPNPDETEDPYPGPEEPTVTPLPTATATSDDDQPAPTPTPSPTVQAIDLTPTQILPPSTASPLITTLTYSETLVVPGGSINQAVWSQDGSTLALATSKGLYQYDAQLLKKQNVFDAGASLLSARLAFNDELLITGGGDAMIRWWDRETKGFLGSLPGHLLGVTRLDLSDFGNFLASGSDDATVRVWDVSTAFNQGVDAVNLLFTFRDPVARVMDMDASPNGEMVAAASQRNVHIWHPQSGVLLKKISQPEGWYTALSFSPDSQVLTTAFDGRRLEFWNTSSWQRFKFIRLSAPVQVLAYSPDGIYLAVGFVDGRIQIWEARSKLLRVDLVGHEGLTSLAFDSIGTRLMASSADGTLRIWDVSPLYGLD